MANRDQKIECSVELKNGSANTVHYRIFVEFDWERLLEQRAADLEAKRQRESTFVGTQSPRGSRGSRSPKSSPRSRSNSPSIARGARGSAVPSHTGERESQYSNYNYITPTASKSPNGRIRASQAIGVGGEEKGGEEVDVRQNLLLTEEERKLFSESLVFETYEGSVCGYGKKELRYRFWPLRKGWHEFKVSVVPVRMDGRSANQGHSTGLEGGCSFQINADVQYPSMQVADVRVDGTTPVSLLWQNFQVDAFNKILNQDVTNVERKYQVALGTDAKKALIPHLKSCQLNFGSSPYSPTPSVVYMVLTNQGDLPIEFKFQTPHDLALFKLSSTLVKMVVSFVNQFGVLYFS